MNLTPAENRELTLAISINQRNPSRHPPRGPGTGYYLALTFGTLLSSQGADAHALHPHGLPSWLDCPTLRRFPASPRGEAGPAALPGRAAQRRSYVRPGGPVKPAAW